MTRLLTIVATLVVALAVSAAPAWARGGSAARCTWTTQGRQGRRVVGHMPAPVRQSVPDRPHRRQLHSH